jgi:hypothetical protein
MYISSSLAVFDPDRICQRDKANGDSQYRGLKGPKSVGVATKSATLLVLATMLK